MNPFQNVNLFQGASAAARFFIFSGLAVGIAEGVKLSDTEGFTLPHQGWSIMLLSCFIVLFNVKATIDDHNYFERSWDTQVVFKYLGFILATFAWMFSGIAALFVYLPIHCTEMLGWSLVISTIWLSIHLIEITIDRTRRNREVIVSLLRQKWAVINMLYLT